MDRCIRRPASWGRRAGRSGRAPCALLQRDAGSIRLRCVAFAAPSRSTASDRTHSTSLSASGSRGARRVSCAAASGSGDWSGQKPPSRGGTNEREMEKSPLIYEELMYFIFQLDLDTQLQRSLNYEAYEMAKEIREKRQAVDDAVARMARVKGKNAGGPSAGAGGGGSAGGQLTAADFASEGLRLRTEMQRAVEQERYADAAKFRDLLAGLEAASKRAQAVAGEWAASAPALRLGQRVLHRRWGYRGVVVGWDLQCCEVPDWVKAAGGEAALAPSRGLRQPFYHLLVDVRDWSYDANQPPVAYVPEEMLSAPETEPGDGRSWVEAHGEEELTHPFSFLLFLGVDARGDLLPCRQLRDKYNVKRRDVYAPGSDGSDGGRGEGIKGKGGGGGGGGGGSGSKSK